MADIDAVLERVFRESYPVVLSSISRLYRDIDLAEDSVQDAMTQALVDWPERGMPDNPPGWIATVARRKAIDRIRRRDNLARKHQILAGYQAVERSEEVADVPDLSRLPDDRLEMIFACCHPALDSEKQIALTLRTVGGLSTAEIARAFMVSEPAMGQRLVRAKTKIRDAGIPFRVPAGPDLEVRLAVVLSVVYLIFNEGYFSADGEALIRDDLAATAIDLGQILAELMPGESEVHALNALMLFQHSRTRARVDARGDLVVLGEQDRLRWDVKMIDRGFSALRRARSTTEPGVYLLQAEIAAHHTVDFADTDWRAIVGLYDRLVALLPSPVAHLNRAVAIGEAYGSEAALAVIESLPAALDAYHAFHSTKAHFFEEVGRSEDAAASYRRALELIGNEPGRRYLESRLRAHDT